MDAEIHQIIQIFGPYCQKPIEGWKILFGREEEGTVLGDFEAHLTRNLCEFILYF